MAYVLSLSRARVLFYRTPENNTQHDVLDGHFDIARYLVENSRVQVGTNDEWTALHNVCLAGDLELVRYLVDECKSATTSRSCLRR